MAIRKKGEEKQIDETPGQVIEIYNGDWEALKNITSKWGFKDEESALRFALAVLTKANSDSLSIDGKNVSPADSLLKDKDASKN